jgi:hypothetical protein
MMKRFLIGINGGHDTAHAIVLDTQPVVPKPPLTSYAGLTAINYHYQSRDQCILNTQVALGLIAQDVGFANVNQFVNQTERIYISIAGAIPEGTSGSFKKELERSFPGTLKKIFDDTWTGLVAQENSPRNGICAFAGHGASVSIAIQGFSEEKAYKIDGWGATIGDFGSGFDLARALFRYLGRQFDRGNVPSCFDYLKHHLETANPHAFKVPKLPVELRGIQNWFDKLKENNPSDWHVRFASLAFAYLSFADSPEACKEDIKIVQHIASDFVETIEIGIRKFAKELWGHPLVLQGEMFSSRIYTEIVFEAMKPYLLTGQLSSCVVSGLNPADGALKLAMIDSDIEIRDYNNLPRKNRTVRNNQLY